MIPLPSVLGPGLLDSRSPESRGRARARHPDEFVMRSPRALLTTAVVACVTIGVASRAAAQPVTPSAPQGTPQPAPVYRTATELVEVDVIVRDRDGRFVADLRPEEFELFEEGVEQRPSVVYLGTTAAARQLLPAAAAPAQGPPALQVQRVDLRERVSVLVFDDEHLSPAAFERLRSAVRSFVTSELDDGDRCGIVVGGTLLNDRLTTDREELLASLAKASPSSESRSQALDLRDWPRLAGTAESERIANRDRAALDAAVRRACADEPSACIAGTAQVESAIELKARSLMTQIQASTRRSLATALTLASGLGRFPGRKTVVLLTEGFQLGEHAADVTRIVEQASRSGVTFYSIDAAGLGRSWRGQDLLAPQPSDPGGPGVPWDAYDTSADATSAMASGTGGRVVRNVNDFDQALRDIALDAGQYYVLGYTPSTPLGDGRFRTIRVRVRRNGMAVRARPGYVAVANTASLLGHPAPDQRAQAVSPEVAQDTARRSEEPGATFGAAVVPATPVEAATTAPGRAIGKPETASPSTPPPHSPASPAPVDAGEPPAIAHLRPDRADRVEALAKGGDASAGPVPEATLAEARRGWERYEQGDVEGAEPLLRNAARDPAAPPWVAYALGQAQLALGRTDEAVASWETVRSRVPEFEPVYFDLADGYLRQRDHDAALRVLRAAEQQWPGDPELLNAIGVIQTSRGTIDAAIDTFERAVQAAPRDATSYFNLGKAYELRYVKSSRYVARFDRWVRDEDARRKAIESYRKYLALGGPYENSARDALGRLAWTPK